jgi:beta-1,4-mannosyl-glycoprotein beta-1,4-N-acetylglucosaminyltransferase
MRVFDSFIFFNELEILEMRLNILNDVVDYFVLTESPFTVSGNEKPLYYQENKDMFGKFNDKIIHNITEQIPNDYSDFLVKKPYYTNYNEYSSAACDKVINIPIRFQRAVFNRDNSIQGILKGGANSDDIILTSDADEIPNPLAIQQIGEWFNPDNHYIMLCKAFYYKLNTLFEEDWKGTRISTLKKLEECSIDMLRQPHINDTAYLIEQGGWHWSFLGDVETMLQKLNAYEHQENNTTENQNLLETRVNNKQDPFGRPQFDQNVIAIDDSFPEYIIQNQDKYSQFIEPWN